VSMIWIAGYTATSSTAFTFSSIPQTFTHLQLRIQSRAAGTASTTLIGSQFNNDYTSGNYSYGSHYLNGNGASVTSSTGQTYLGFGSGPNGASYGFIPGASITSGVFSSQIVDIFDYTNTNKFKAWRAIGGYDANGSGNAALFSGYWNQTSAITVINIGNYLDPYTFATGTRIDLYGISTSSVTGA